MSIPECEGKSSPVEVRDALVKVALQGLDQLPPYTVNTTLLSSTSLEAESATQWHLLLGWCVSAE